MPMSLDDLYKECDVDPEYWTNAEILYAKQFDSVEDLRMDREFATVTSPQTRTLYNNYTESLVVLWGLLNEEELP